MLNYSWNLYFTHALCVGITSSDNLVSNKKCCVNVNIEGRKLLAKLIITSIKTFDVILGLDWLVRHFGTIKCWKKGGWSLVYLKQSHFIFL